MKGSSCPLVSHIAALSIYLSIYQFCSTRVRVRVSHLLGRCFSHLNHVPSLFALVIFLKKVLYFLPWTLILPNSASQVTRIIHVNHCPWLTFLISKIFFSKNIFFERYLCRKYPEKRITSPSGAKDKYVYFFLQMIWFLKYRALLLYCNPLCEQVSSWAQPFPHWSLRKRKSSY